MGSGEILRKCHTETFRPAGQVLVSQYDSYAEYAKAPLENCYPLDEKRLLGSPAEGGLGYRIGDILYAFRQLVPFGGLVDIDLKPGETIIIAPATGTFGGAAVGVALAMGARVIAAARNAESLKRLAATHDRILTVQLTGDIETDAEALKQFGTVDAFQDWCPPTAAKTTHIKGVDAGTQSWRTRFSDGWNPGRYFHF